MTKLVLFKASSFEELWKTPDGEARIQTLGIVADIIGQHYIGSGQVPTEGYRLIDYKYDQASATIEHHGGATHERQSPWRVVKTEEYPANTGMEEFSEIVIAYCELAPLPDEENPWIELGAPIISPDSFGGDVAAYQDWKAAHSVGVS